MARRRKLSSSFKLKKNNQVVDDRISELPDEILVCILSLLTLKEAARTSVLSSRWMNLWKYTSRLHFDAPKSLDRIAKNRKLLINEERLKYVHWVNHVLDLHKGSLDEFKLDFDLDISSQNEIDRWLEYAFKKGVQSLELYLLFEGILCHNFFECYNFPDHLLNLNGGLSEAQPLHMNSSAHGLPKLVAFGSLRALCLKGVNVTGEVIEYFLHTCHFLERLVVLSANKLVNLQVSGPSLMLKYLKIDFCHKLKSLKICDCGLVSLAICQVESLVLRNVPTLAKLTIAGRSPSFWSIVLSQVSHFVSQLERLKLRDLKPKHIMELHEFPQLSQLKELVITTAAWNNDDSLMGLISWINASPCLQKFVLKIYWFQPLKIVREKEKGAKSTTLKHLREIELGGYYGRTSEVELLMYLIENAVALEKIVIRPWSQTPSGFPKPNAATRALKEVKQLVPKHVELVIL